MQKNIYGMKFQLATLAFAIFTVLASFFSNPNPVSAAPFICGPGFYQSTIGELLKLNPSTGNYTTVGATAYSLNAIGFNTEDNYIYGMNNAVGGSTLVKVEDDGTYTDLGAVTGMPTTGGVVGDFDHSGNLYVLNSATSIYKIDVSAVTATEITLSASALGINDFAYINGHLYGTNGTSLYDITIADGNVAVKSLGLPATVYGAAWATMDNQLYFGQNTNGVIYEITNYTTGSPQATAVLQGQAGLVGNDGASCSLAPTVIIPVTAANDTASTDMNIPISVNAQNGLLKNDSPETVTVSSNTQPANGTVVVSPDGSYTYTPNNGFTGTDSFTYTISDTLGATDTATVTIIVNEVAATDTTVPQVPGVPSAGLFSKAGPMVALIITTITLAAVYAIRQKKGWLTKR